VTSFLWVLWWEFSSKGSNVKVLVQRAKAFWSSLPHQVQAIVIVFGTVTSTTLGHELQALIFGTGGFTWPSLEHTITTSCLAGFIAARAFYMLPNREMPAQAVLTSSSPAPQSIQPPAPPLAEKRSQ
jgi:hypothetical protein